MTGSDVDPVSSSAAGPPAGELPRSLGEFRLVRELGRGGMGVVYEAEQPALGRRVALKLLRHARGGRGLQRFLREARAVARLHHTNIVSLHGVVAEGDEHLLVMELVEGRPLDRVIDELRLRRRLDARGDEPSGTAGPRDELSITVASSVLAGVSPDGPPSADERSDVGSGAELPLLAVPRAFYRNAARIGLQVAQALAHAHARGVLHRDLKPSNILVDEEPRAWVTDFGLAKLADDVDLTRADEVVGTVRYMAPERFRGRSDERTDVHGLGLTLYELLALRPAFGGSDQGDTLEDVLRGRPLPLRRLDPRVPRDLSTIVAKAMAREPVDRYQSAAALASDLERFLEGRSVAARRPPPHEQLWRWCRRNPIVAALSSVTLGLLVTVAVLSSASATRLREALEQTQAAQLDGRRRLFESYLAQARALRVSGRPGQRFEALEALGRARELVEPLGLGADRVLELRNEALATMVRLDLEDDPAFTRLRHDVAGFGPGLRRHAFVEGGDTLVVIGPEGAELRRVPFVGGPRLIHPVQLSSDGSYLAVLASAGRGSRGRAQVVDLRDGQMAVSPGESVEWDLHLRPDGRQAAVVADEAIVLHDLEARRQVARIEPSLRPYRARYSADGELLATCSGSTHQVEVWHVDSRELVVELGSALAGRQRCAVAWHPERPILATSRGGRIGLWRVDTGELMAELSGHGADATSLAFNSTGDLLASSSWAIGARLWAMDTLEQVMVMEHLRVRRFDGPERLIVHHTVRDRLEVRKVTSGESPVRLEGRPASGTLRLLAFAGRRGRLVVGCFDDGLGLWDAASGGLLDFLELPEAGSFRPAPPGGELLGRAGDALAWIPVIDEPSSGRPARLGEPRLEPLGEGEIRNAVRTGDGRHLAVLLQDGRILAFDASRLDEPLWDVRDTAAVDLALSADSRWLATSTHASGADRSTARVRVWDVRTGEPVAALQPGGWTRPSFSPDGRTLALVSSSWLDLWRVGSWERLHRVRLDRNTYTGWAAHAPDGSTVAVGHRVDAFRLIDVDTGRELATLAGSERIVGSMRFDPSGERLAVAYPPHAMRVWDLRAIRSQLRRIGLDW